MQNPKTYGVGVIILAAGLGTRMKSDKAKVLHEIIEKPMVLYVMKTAACIAGSNITVVIGHQGEKVKQTVSEKYEASFAFQDKQLGTGHAVQSAIPEISDSVEDVIILCGDVPLIEDETLFQFYEIYTKQNLDICVLAVEIDDPTGYGRVLTDSEDNLIGIVEHADATLEQRAIKRINTGIYCVKSELLAKLLAEIKADNTQEEYYLTDIIDIACKKKKKIGIMIGTDPDEFIGVNTLEDLSRVELIMKKRLGKIS